MIYVISGTNRPGSRTLQVAHEVLAHLKTHSNDVELIDLAALPYDELTGHQYPGGPKEMPSALKTVIEKLDNSDGVVIVTPEYNGSMPGALKYFIDHLSYPKFFEYRPVAFVGLGFRWGGLRPVEHLQQVFGYRNAFIFPERVFLMNITNILKDGKIVDDSVRVLIDKQAEGFIKFVKALKNEKLHSSYR